MKQTKAEKAEAVQHATEMLSRLCPPGTTVYTILRSVARSGMSRTLDVCVVDREGRINTITHAVAALTGMRRDRNGAIVVGGYGFDAGYDVVQGLSYKLHGFKDRGADAIASEGRPFKPRRGHFRAGYSLEHRWL